MGWGPCPCLQSHRNHYQNNSLRIFPSRFHFARFTLSYPPNTSVFLPRPPPPLHAPLLARPRPFLARSSPGLACSSPGPRPVLARPRPASPGPRPPSFKQSSRQNGQKRSLLILPGNLPVKSDQTNFLGEFSSGRSSQVFVHGISVRVPSDQ